MPNYRKPPRGLSISFCRQISHIFCGAFCDRGERIVRFQVFRAGKNKPPLREQRIHLLELSGMAGLCLSKAVPRIHAVQFSFCQVRVHSKRTRVPFLSSDRIGEQAGPQTELAYSCFSIHSEGGMASTRIIRASRNSNTNLRCS
jgi:hypothetical protein